MNAWGVRWAVAFVLAGAMTAMAGVKPLGRVGETFDRMCRNHILPEDTVYLTDFYRTRSETRFWQTEFWGKYMHTAVPVWQMTRCPTLKAKLDAGIENLLPLQSADGYLGNYSEAARFAPGTWDVWGVKYTMLGLLHYYDATGDRRTLEACGRLCDYLIGKVGPGAKVTIAATGNYAGMPSCSVLEPVVWLYNRTREKRFLAFADFIVREMTERADGPRLLDLALASVPVAERSKIPAGGIWAGQRTNRGKAYEMMSCYQGLLEYYEVTGRTNLLEAAVATAHDIVSEEINLAGSGAASEHWYHGRWHQHEAIGHTQETCVTITWMRLCEKLLKLTGNALWAEQLERTFYNAYLASLRPDGRLFAAYTPLDGSRSEGHLHCRTHTNCCNENGPRGFLSFFNAAVVTRADSIDFNEYFSSRVETPLPGADTPVVFDVHTLYPADGLVTIEPRLAKPMPFRLRLRIPRTTGDNTLAFNGQPLSAVPPSGTDYVTIDRTWKPGDVVALTLGLKVRAHRLGDAVAFTRGPILLARDTRFADGDIGETIRWKEIAGSDLDKLFGLARSDNPETTWLTVDAALPMGKYNINPNGRRPDTVRFCDFASAANGWCASSVGRVWLPIERHASDILAPRRGLDRTRINIGAYKLKPYCRTEAHVRDIAAAGVDFMVAALDRPTLDLFAKHGVGCMLAGQVPNWWGGKPGCCGNMLKLNPLTDYDRAAESFVDHPAVWGIDVGDEPSALDFAHYGRIVSNTRHNYPGKFVFLNLFPNYALPGKEGQDLSKTQLGSRSYREHLETYCRDIPLDYLCLDHYTWGWNNNEGKFLDNLRLGADACQGSGKSFWIVLQANRHIEGARTNRAMTVNTLRYQVNASLAYGAETIIWACWSKGWWEENILDAHGNRTPAYDRVKIVNGELHRLSDDYMKFRRQRTDLVGFEPSVAKGAGQPSFSESNGTVFHGVKAADAAKILVGHFTARDGSNGAAIYVAAWDDREDVHPANHEIVFRCASPAHLRAVDGDGAVDVRDLGDGRFAVSLKSNRGVLVCADRFDR